MKVVFTFDNFGRSFQSCILHWQLESCLHGWQLCIGNKWKSFTHHWKLQLQDHHQLYFLTSNDLFSRQLYLQIIFTWLQFSLWCGTIIIMTEILSANEVWIQTFIYWNSQACLFNRLLCNPFNHHPYSPLYFSSLAIVLEVLKCDIQSQR